MPSNKHFYLFAPAILLLIVLLWRGCQDKVDPDWISLDEQFSTEYFTLNKAADSLQILWESFHGLDTTDDSLAYRIVSTPFAPTVEYRKFKGYVEKLQAHPFLLLSSVSGGGTSTLLERLSRFLASKPENILYLRCAPQFDLEYYRDFIGTEENGEWKSGKLLQLFGRCRQNPHEKFIFVIDDFDKINPETFFGPEFWEKFTDAGYAVVYGRDTIELPPNFNMIMVIHAGVGERVKLNNEHFRRLGNPSHLEPSAPEMVCFLQDELKKIKGQLAAATLTEKPELEERLASLQDTAHLKRFLYSFIKINELIKDKYGPSFRLGTWSNLRKLYKKSDYGKVADTFIEHVNSLQPEEALALEDLEDIQHTVKTNGKLAGTSLIASVFVKMEEMGFLTEFVVGLTFLVLSAISSWYFFKKRQQFIKDYTDKIYVLIQDFEKGKINYDKAGEEFVRIKKEVDNLVIQKKVNYTEATFFYNFIEDKIKRIEMARLVNENFRDLVRVFMEDNVINESEHKKLLSFLEGIRHKISLQDYLRFKEEVEELLRKFHE